MSNIKNNDHVMIDEKGRIAGIYCYADSLSETPAQTRLKRELRQKLAATEKLLETERRGRLRAESKAAILISVTEAINGLLEVGRSSIDDIDQ